MEKKYLCPCCGEDIGDFVKECIKTYNKQRVAANMRKKITPERRAEMNAASCERIKKWRKNNPEKTREFALKASRSRTAESFARQKEAIKDTARRKTLKFAELLFTEQQKGTVITAEIENQLMLRAKEIIKQENKENKKKAGDNMSCRSAI